MGIYEEFKKHGFTILKTNMAETALIIINHTIFLNNTLTKEDAIHVLNDLIVVLMGNFSYAEARKEAI